MWCLLTIAFLSLISSIPLQKRIFVIVLENETLDSTLSDPSMATLAQKGQLLMNYHAVAGGGVASLPNYLALVGGDDFGIQDNLRHSLSGDCLANLLQANAISWRSYLEDYPGQCFDGDLSRDYVRRHNPFLYFNSIRNVDSLCSNLQNWKPFASDLVNNSPQYVLYIPSVARMTTVSVSAAFTSALVDTLVPTFTRNAIIIITCAGVSAGQQVFTLIIDPANPSLAGTKDYTYYDHYSLLASVEINFDLGNLGRRDATAVPITYVATGTIVPQVGSSTGNGVTGGDIGTPTSGPNSNGNSNSNSDSNSNGNGGTGNGASGIDGNVGKSGNSISGLSSGTSQSTSSTGMDETAFDASHQPKPSSLPTGLALAIAFAAFCFVVACGVLILRRLNHGSKRGSRGTTNNTKQALLRSSSKNYSVRDNPETEANEQEVSVSEDPYLRGDMNDSEINADDMHDVDDPNISTRFAAGAEVPMKTLFPVQEMSDSELQAMLAQGPMEREMKERGRHGLP